LSVHSFGAYYLWNGTAQQFDLEHGEPLRWNEGGARADWFPAYPDAVQVMTTLDGARHPIVFSANGSHGLWASSGSHVYFPVLPLVDHCDTGTPWRTWENLILLPWQKHYCEPDLQWINFRGDWGNSADGCEVSVVSGECALNGGPSGPPKGPGLLPAPFVPQ